MGSNNGFVCFLLLALLASFASSAHISEDAFQPHDSVGRSLLQAVTPCPVDFANANYTVITSKCKGPNYQAATCCPAFLEFACPYSEQINDLKTDCAQTMFSHINLYGKYPHALFSSLCKGDKEGVVCPPELEKKSGGVSGMKPSKIAAAAGLLLFLLLKMF